ncbi:MAG: hypothetical protein HOV82_10615 [Streptomyces sp.]|nr:hypothetical protein [Streptomyces sp.]
MDPVIVGAVVTVAVSVVNGIVKVAQRRLSAGVERARIAEDGQTDRIRSATGRTAQHPLPARVGRNGGSGHGGRAQH